MWELDYKESWVPRIDAFEPWCWRRLLGVPWTARGLNYSIVKEFSPEYSWEDWYRGQNSNTLVTWWELSRKDPDVGKVWRQEETGMTEDEMIGGHHWLDGLESEKAVGVGVGQKSLVCYRPWGQKESDMTELLNWSEVIHPCIPLCIHTIIHGLIECLLKSRLTK